jgi:hypothetical protein
MIMWAKAAVCESLSGGIKHFAKQLSMTMIASFRHGHRGVPIVNKSPAETSRVECVNEIKAISSINPALPTLIL